MAGVPLTGLAEEIERRIAAKMKRYQPDDPALREALLRIGFMLEAQAKINIRRQGIIDTGRLLNSIQTRFYTRGDRVGINVGSFGVPYAALHEFGGPFTDRQRRAMFASLRERGRLGPNRKGTDKGVIQGGQFRARPYLRPAIDTHRQRIIDIIRGLFR